MAFPPTSCKLPGHLRWLRIGYEWQGKERMIWSIGREFLSSPTSFSPSNYHKSLTVLCLRKRMFAVTGDFKSVSAFVTARTGDLQACVLLSYLVSHWGCRLEHSLDGKVLIGSGVIDPSWPLALWSGFWIRLGFFLGNTSVYSTVCGSQLLMLIPQLPKGQNLCSLFINAAVCSTGLWNLKY